jgi:hypothetical protein
MRAIDIALLLKPFAALVLFGLIVLPIELLLARFWPEGRLKRVLFDRSFQARHPWIYTLVWFVVMAMMIASVVWYVNTR